MLKSGQIIKFDDFSQSVCERQSMGIFFMHVLTLFSQNYGKCQMSCGDNEIAKLRLGQARNIYIFLKIIHYLRKNFLKSDWYIYPAIPTRKRNNQAIVKHFQIFGINGFNQFDLEFGNTQSKTTSPLFSACNVLIRVTMLWQL